MKMADFPANPHAGRVLSVVAEMSFFVPFFMIFVRHGLRTRFSRTRAKSEKIVHTAVGCAVAHSFGKKTAPSTWMKKMADFPAPQVGRMLGVAGISFLCVFFDFHRSGRQSPTAA